LNLGGLLGTAGGFNGTGVSAPSTNNLVDPSQLTTAYTASQNGLAQQQALIQALQAQNGLQNQSNVYNQLANVAAGTGPNPAQAQLAQATGANTANQAALMAGQRGAQQNVGLIARQAAQQGATNQQNAAGQAATMQSQQQLNALGQMGGVANTQAQQQIGATQNYNQAAQNEQMGMLNAAAGLQSNVNSANAGLIGATMGQQASIGSSMSSSIGSMMSMAGGGAVDSSNFQYTPQAPGIDTGGPLSAVGQWFSQIANTGQKSQSKKSKPDNTTTGTADSSEMAGGPSDTMDNSGGASPGGGMGGDNGPTMQAAHGGRVPAMVSPGEQYLNPRQVKEVADGKKQPLKTGTRIPGKPKVGGAKNDYANDTVPKTLEEGGIVIPRSVTQGKNPHWEAMKFVHATMAKSRHKSK
jgi:hypothetical protein